MTATTATRICDVTMPAANVPARRAWLSERIVELKAGRLNSLIASGIGTAVVGWTDLCSTADRREYQAMVSEWYAARG